MRITKPDGAGTLWYFCTPDVGTQGEQSRVSFIQSYTLFAKEATLGNDHLAHPTVGLSSQVT